MSKPLTRRQVIFSSLGLVTLSALTWLKPFDKGAPHSPYFQTLSDTLKTNRFSRPTLLIDKERVRKNIQTLKNHLKDNFDYRIVAKSLPSIPLLKWVSEESGTNRFMLFNERFLLEVSKNLSDSDILMGKPLPVNAAEYFYQNQSLPFNPEKQLQWLIDTPERLAQYNQLAQQHDTNLLINIELDIGLHRGGVTSDKMLLDMLAIIQSSEHLKFSGFMGYEPHVVKVPGNPEDHLAEAMTVYQARVATAKSFLGKDYPTQPTLNSGGSPSYQLHTKENSVANELAAGSCLVKPSDFDLDILSSHKEASFIATPVLKQIDQTEIPGVSGLGELMSWWDPNRQQSFFTYGGYWKANPVSPDGLSINPVYGRSTNQEMLNGSNSIPLKPDDWIFLRPTQSEFVFLQFGDIAVYENGQFVENWPVLNS